MSPWHLAWIIPLSGSFGLVIGSCLAMAGETDEAIERAMEKDRAREKRGDSQIGDRDPREKEVSLEPDSQTR